MIWLLAHPFAPPSPVSKSDSRHTGRLRKRDNFLTGEGEGGKGVLEEPNHSTEKKEGFYKLFNALWLVPSRYSPIHNSPPPPADLGTKMEVRAMVYAP
jgi:hypothetical protein